MTRTSNPIIDWKQQQWKENFKMRVTGKVSTHQTFQIFLQMVPTYFVICRSAAKLPRPDYV